MHFAVPVFVALAKRLAIGPKRLFAALVAALILTTLSISPVSALPAGFVGSANRPFNDGYWLVTASGEVNIFGNAAFFGDMRSNRLNKPIVGMASTTTGNGYWLVASDGGIFSFGDAIFRGSTGGIKLNKPIVGMAATPSGLGYWLVATDGGIFAFGDADFFGSTGSIKLNKPIVGMASTPTGKGYWMVATDGGIFAFGDASFFGSTGSLGLSQPIVGMTSTQTGTGYWLAGADGGIFNFGDARFLGSATKDNAREAISIVRTVDGGYGVVRADGTYDHKAALFEDPASEEPPTPPTTEAPAPEPTTTTAPPASTTTTVRPTTTTVRPTTTTIRPSTTTTTAAPPSTGGWQLVAQENFDGSSIDSTRWSVYSGKGNAGVGWRKPEAVRVTDGALRLDGYSDIGGGVCWCGRNAGDQLYGRWEFRAKIDKGNGYGPAALLWPASGKWPVDGEIDISEIPQGARTSSHATLHWGTNNSQKGWGSNADFSQWHTFAVDWLPGSITFYVDGNVVGSTTNPAAIPTKPMHLALQNDVGKAGAWIPGRDANTPEVVTYHIDWVKIYRQ